jgi:hypothetical protein
MKKLLTLTVFLTVFVTNAQEISFGVKGGLNIANITGGDADRNNLLSFHLGGVAEIPVSEKFSIQPELLYTRQGSETENIVKIKLDYLALPIMAKYYVTNNLSIEAGPQAAFLVRDKADFNNSNLEGELDANTFDFGLNIGAGYKLPSGFFTQLRYNYGVTVIAENPDLKNSVFQLSVGYQF